MEMDKKFKERLTGDIGLILVEDKKNAENKEETTEEPTER